MSYKGLTNDHYYKVLPKNLNCRTSIFLRISPNWPRTVLGYSQIMCMGYGGSMDEKV